MSDEPRDPSAHTEVHRVADPDSTRVAGYLAQPGEVGRVLLLYSGGLDTSVMLKWIQDEYEAEVVALTVNLGQPGEDYEVVKGKALQLGALDCHVVDAREEFVREYVLPAIKANADYGDGYPLFTSLGRPLIAKLAVEYARKSGCDTIAHGCTGKGNDQVRIEGTVATLAPELKVIAPVRSWAMGRDEEIAYARKHGIPVKGGTESAPYSIDDNLWGRSSEGKWIEDLAHAPDDDVFQLVTRPELAPDEAQTVEVTFEAGVPVALDGERMEPVELIERAAEIGIRHGVGIVDHIEDRIVGLKVRDIYEVPAAAILLKAHRELERLTGTIHQNQFKPGLDQKWAYLVYAGLWWEPLRADLQAYIDHVNRRVTGTIGLQLYKGNVRVVTRESPNAVYDAQLATFAESGGLFSQNASPGFIELWTLQSRMAHRLAIRRRVAAPRRVGSEHVLQAAGHAGLERREGAPPPQVRADVRPEAAPRGRRSSPSSPGSRSSRPAATAPAPSWRARRRGRPRALSPEFAGSAGSAAAARSGTIRRAWPSPPPSPTCRASRSRPSSGCPRAPTAASCACAGAGASPAWPSRACPSCCCAPAGRSIASSRSPTRASPATPRRGGAPTSCRSRSWPPRPRRCGSSGPAACAPACRRRRPASPRPPPPRPSRPRRSPAAR